MTGTGAGRNALGPETVRSGRKKLQGSEEAVPGYGETSQLHQPVPRRGAPQYAGSYQGTPQASGPLGFASSGGLPPYGNWGTQGKGGGRRCTLEGGGGAQEPDRSGGEGGQNCKGRTGQVERGGLEDPRLLGISGRGAQQGVVV